MLSDYRRILSIILNDLLRITICTAAGAGVAGAMAAVFKVSSKVPAGGFFALPELITHSIGC